MLMIRTPFEQFFGRFVEPVRVRNAQTETPFERFIAQLLSGTVLTPSVTDSRRREDLRIYQVGTVTLIKRIWSDGDDKLPGIILAYDMGSGKTVSTLTALRDLLDAGIIRKALIIAPLLVAETVWPTEIEDWEHLRRTTFTLIRGTDVVRQELARADTEIHIINKELVPWLWMNSDRGKTWDYDVIVIDEASMLKNGKKRTKLKKLTRFGALAQARSKTKAIIELTGTPAPNGLQNLWGLAYIIDRGERLGDNQKKFMDRYFDVNPFSYQIKERDGARKAITDAISDIMFSLDPRDYTELPECVPLEIKVRLPPKIMKEYKRFERTLISEEYDVEAVTNAVLANKLLQYASGSMYQEDGNDIFIHDLKLDALSGLVEELDGTPLLVAYSYKFDLRRIRQRFPKAVVLNKSPDVMKTMRQWNAGQIEMLLAHPLSAAHGLNMQYGSNQACWYGLNADLELYQQFNKRLARPGSKSSHVFLHHIIAEGTHDEDILPVLKNKDATQSDVLDATRIHFQEAV
ncbi:SNF2-related protein [Rhizobium nepotum]|uniref:SNF2-related protein n=1 Tax=Rhizobium nepotum TaxID=1035271 RepID=UPI003CF51D85